MSIFSQENKVASRVEGIIYKWNGWKEGSKFGGTYLGSHTWTNKEEQTVIAHDFANCEIDGKQCPPTEIHTFNGTAVLNKILADIRPGQRIGFEYVGKAPRVGQRDGARLFNKFLNPNDFDANWKSYLAVGAVVDEENVPIEQAFAAAPAAAPLATHSSPEVPDFGPTAQENLAKIMGILGSKFGIKENNAGAGILVKSLTQMEFVESNYPAILAILQMQK